jgi:hypothetical protein
MFKLLASGVPTVSFCVELQMVVLHAVSALLLVEQNGANLLRDVSAPFQQLMRGLESCKETRR